MLVKYNPMNNWLDLRNDFDRWFDGLFNKSDFGNAGNIQMVPSVDVEETDNEYKFYAELPGMEKGDINITLEDNVLTISGEKKAENEKKDDSFHLVERRHGKFSRSFRLPVRVDSNKVDAEYKNGVLNIVVGKAEEAKPKQIAVKVK